MTRHIIRMLLLITLAAVPAIMALADETTDIKALREARRDAAWRPRRIVMNNDGNDGRKAGLKPGVEAFLSSRTSPLVGSQVDAVFYCTGVFNLYTHRSEETEPRTGGDKGVADLGWDLTRFGTDSLEQIVKFCHEHDMEAFWSMRMNDTHDSGDEALLCAWKREHPEWLMGKKGDKFPHGGGRWSAVNYAIPEVRDKVFRILADVCKRYDVDGIELDFYRHPVYFKPQMTGEPVTQEHCDMMTDLLRRLRAMTEEQGLRRGRPLLISVRVPDSVGFGRAIGLDVPRWLEDGLVDILVGGGYFHLEPWQNLVALGHGHDTPVYACISASRFDPSRPDIKDPALWHGAAKEAWDGGVDGIYTFNLFDPKSKLFRELGSPDTLMPLGTVSEIVTGNPKSMERWLKGGATFLKLNTE